jgi:hypothetical protein
VDVGDTVTLEPLPAPFDQLYVLAPLAVSVEDCPEYIVDGIAEAVIVGVLLTTTLTVVVAEQPADVPVTV